SLFAMFNAWMLYRPFFKVYERQLAETESCSSRRRRLILRRHLLISSSFRSTAGSRRHSCHFM
ncbi:hypothetical protein JTM67_35900, partial [Pseudomonas aeruginosa]|nr:hypothetical protein [Pseudomonas aeruginosa]